MSGNASKYYGIQALRFAAALMVLIYHSWLYWSIRYGDAQQHNGYWMSQLGGMGVTIFFVISGFVLTHAVQREDSLKFILHRLLRIYPAFFFAVLLVVVVKFSIWKSYPWGEHFFRSLLLIPSGTITYPLSIEWSLIYEIFFYFILALIWIPRNNKYLVTFSVAWLCAILWGVYYRPNATALLPDDFWIFFSAYNFPFVLGIFTYYLHKKITGGHIPVILLLSIALMLLAGYLDQTHWRIITGACGAWLLVGAIAIRDSQGYWVKSDNTIVKFGDYSYGLYLIHAAVIDICFALFFREGKQIDPVSVGLLGLSIGLAYGALEFRFYQKSRKWINEKLTIILQGR